MRKKTKVPDIGLTETDILSELAEIQPTRDPRERVFSYIEDVAIWRARVEPEAGKKAVPWRVFMPWFRDKFGHISESTVRGRIQTLIRQGGPQK